jgi:hypothetical protein
LACAAGFPALPPLPAAFEATDTIAVELVETALRDAATDVEATFCALPFLPPDELSAIEALDKATSAARELLLATFGGGRSIQLLGSSGGVPGIDPRACFTRLVASAIAASSAALKNGSADG